MKSRLKLKVQRIQDSSGYSTTKAVFSSQIFEQANTILFYQPIDWNQKKKNWKSEDSKGVETLERDPIF